MFQTIEWLPVISPIAHVTTSYKLQNYLAMTVFLVVVVLLLFGVCDKAVR